MNRIISALAAMAAAALGAAAADGPAQLKALQGEWTATRTNRDGQPYLQTIRIDQDRLSFTISSEDGTPRYAAKGKISTGKLGPFSTWTVSDIQAGRAGEDLAPLGDDHVSIYTLRGDDLAVAANFDKERENQAPRVDAYTRGKPSKAQASPSPADALAGLWKLDLELGDNTLDYELRLTREGQGLAGVLISPRSGEHKIKSVVFKDGKLTMEIPRDLEGTEATFVYQGALKDGALSGTATVRGFEDQVSGKWKAAK